MATITQTIKNYLEPYWDDDFKIVDISVIKTIEEKIFKACEVDYAMNIYHDSADETIYCIFSWIEDGKLQTFELLIENYND